MPIPPRNRPPLRRTFGKEGELPRRPAHTPPALPTMSSGASSVALLRLKAQKRLALRQRMGLLKNKAEGEDLNDVERKMLEHELAIA